MTQLRKQMLEELQRRNYSQTTVKGYLKVVEAFAKYFHRSPDQLGPEQIRAYQAYLFTETKAECAHGRAPHGSFALLLLQDTEARLPD